jgi:ABC-type lipoprotein export system ATPase subunit
MALDRKPPIVSADNVSLVYQRGTSKLTVLSDITLSIYPGSFVGLVGPSGSGKSSLLNILGLVTSPHSGTVQFGDEFIDFSRASYLRSLRRTFIGFVFQRFNLLPTLTAKENIMVSLRLSGESAKNASERADHLLSEVGLAERRNHVPSQLSGGEMQRVAVCRAVAHRPKMILADEPTGSLDTASGEQVLQLLAQTTQSGTAVLIATHSAEAESYCSSVIRLRDGQIIR